MGKLVALDVGGFGGCTQALVLNSEGYPEETTCKNGTGTHLGTGPLKQPGGLHPGDLQPGSQGRQKWDEGWQVGRVGAETIFHSGMRLNDIHTRQRS